LSYPLYRGKIFPRPGGRFSPGGRVPFLGDCDSLVAGNETPARGLAAVRDHVFGETVLQARPDTGFQLANVVLDLMRPQRQAGFDEAGGARGRWRAGEHRRGIAPHIPKGESAGPRVRPSLVARLGDGSRAPDAGGAIWWHAVDRAVAASGAGQSPRSPPVTCRPPQPLQLAEGGRELGVSPAAAATAPRLRRGAGPCPETPWRKM
jgi:hypothetical protein